MLDRKRRKCKEIKGNVEGNVRKCNEMKGNQGNVIKFREM